MVVAQGPSRIMSRVGFREESTVFTTLDIHGSSKKSENEQVCAPDMTAERGFKNQYEVGIVFCIGFTRASRDCTTHVHVV